MEEVLRLTVMLPITAIVLLLLGWGERSTAFLSNAALLPGGSKRPISRHNADASSFFTVPTLTAPITDKAESSAAHVTTNLTSSHAGRTKNSKNGTGRKRQAATSATVNRTRVEIGLFGRTAFKGDIPEASMEGVLQALIDLEKEGLTKQVKTQEADTEGLKSEVEALTQTVLILSNELNKEREARVAAEALVERMYTSVLQEAKEQTDEHRLRAAVRDMELRLRALEMSTQPRLQMVEQNREVEWSVEEKERVVEHTVMEVEEEEEAQGSDEEGGGREEEEEEEVMEEEDVEAKGAGMLIKAHETEEAGAGGAAAGPGKSEGGGGGGEAGRFEYSFTGGGKPGGFKGFGPATARSRRAELGAQVAKDSKGRGRS